MATHRSVNKGYEYENPVDSNDNEMNSSRPSASKENIENVQPNLSQTDHLNVRQFVCVLCSILILFTYNYVLFSKFNFIF